MEGFALWKAARRSEKWWFIALLLINTLAVLEILYISCSAGKIPAWYKRVTKDRHIIPFLFCVPHKSAR